MGLLRDLMQEIRQLRSSIEGAKRPPEVLPPAPTRMRVERHTMEGLAKRQAVQRMQKLGLLTPGVAPPEKRSVVRRDGQ
jgi:hypothetical protein